MWLLPVTGWTQDHTTDLLDGENWKQQGLESIMPAWMENGVDTTDGQFYAYMDRKWKSYGENLKYPGMLSRHLFSYSAAYMLSGDHRYLDKADSLFNYLVKNGWDHQYGGWHYAINSRGEAVNSQKDLFMNIYAVTGLAMYYMITHHKKAMEFIEKSRSLLREYAWDDTHGGYYRRLNQSWEVTDSTKVFTPQVAPVSGYLLYLYVATRDRAYLEESEQLMSLVYQHMWDPATGWIREKFGRSWKSISDDKKNEQIDIGHNIEVSWMLIRLYAITGNPSYKERAEALYERLNKYAFRPNGAWLHKMALTDTGAYSETTNWWIQAYGNMLQPPMYRYENNPATLDNFKKGSAFWNRAFVDEQYGGTVLSATLDGTVDRGDKAVRSKTSYHAMELALLNYLYLNLWINEQPVTLYFHFDSASDDKPLCPLPIYDSRAIITEASSNGASLDPESSDPCIDIPEGTKNYIKVSLN